MAAMSGSLRASISGTATMPQYALKPEGFPGLSAAAPTVGTPPASATANAPVCRRASGSLPRRPVLHCRVRWAPGTLVLWDNRCVQHHVTYDYYPYARYGQRVAINGGSVKSWRSCRIEGRPWSRRSSVTGRGEQVSDLDPEGVQQSLP